MKITFVWESGVAVADLAAEIEQAMSIELAQAAAIDGILCGRLLVLLSAQEPYTALHGFALDEECECVFAFAYPLMGEDKASYRVMTQRTARSSALHGSLPRWLH